MTSSLVERGAIAAVRLQWRLGAWSSERTTVLMCTKVVHRTTGLRLSYVMRISVCLKLGVLCPRSPKFGRVEAPPSESNSGGWVCSAIDTCIDTNLRPARCQSPKRVKVLAPWGQGWGGGAEWSRPWAGQGGAGASQVPPWPRRRA